MDDEEPATLEGQFSEFSRLLDTKRDGTTITLYRSDYWMRQGKIIEDRKITMTDTGILFNKFCKTELTFDEWSEFLSDLCRLKELDEEEMKTTLTNCGLPEVVYCNVTFDKFLCWPPTPAGHTARQACPPVQALNAYGEAVRQCGQGGAWIDRDGNGSDVGWTNYTDCIDARARHTLDQLENGNPEVKLEIAQRTRYLELVGFSTSLIALIVSLVIFYRFRSLRNTRTRIHKNLFLAMVLQVVVRLTVYIDHAIIRFLNGDYALYQNARRGIYNMPYLCESFYILLEYGNTAMFMWMLVEGLYLHRVVTTSALREHACRPLYYFAGWVAPALGTAFWVLLNSFFYDTTAQCWWGYNFSALYWILQGPRLAVILINMVFLLNIIRVLIVKMKMTISSDLEKAKKAVRAAAVLLPLLGITNVLSMTEAPLDGAVWRFALWCYVVHFLTSFQGLFLAILYCFLNGEVRLVLRKCLEDRAARRQGNIFFFLYSNSDTPRGSRNRAYSSGNGFASSLQLRRQRSEHKSGSAGGGGSSDEAPARAASPPPSPPPLQPPPTATPFTSSATLKTRGASLNEANILAFRSY